ncbi:hypothetical protein, partial [Weissella confusa]|uniref:hypothetical protein n=1 Tax=Weissella confusa TaxID=1583 RepID=UPI00223B76A2
IISYFQKIINGIFASPRADCPLSSGSLQIKKERQCDLNFDIYNFWDYNRIVEKDIGGTNYVI